MSKQKKIKDNAKCPICQKDRKGDEFEVHHVIPRVYGGSNDPVNLLPICATCHAIVTRACPEDMMLIDNACFFHQLGQHGLDFVLKSGMSTGNPIHKYVTKNVEVDAEELSCGLQDVGWRKYFEFVDKIKQQAYFIPLPQMVKWGPPEKLVALNPY